MARGAGQVSAWIAGLVVVVPSLAMAQDRTDREIVEAIVGDGPQARVIRAETEVVRREQFARMTYQNPNIQYSREGAGFTEFIQFEQSLPALGLRRTLMRAGIAATEAAEAERDSRLWRLRSDAAMAVARLIAEQDRLSAAQEHSTEVERLIEILRTREREGEGSKFDRLRAEQELRETRQAVSIAAVAVADTRAAVSAMLPADASYRRITATVSISTPSPPLESLFTRATSSRAELRVLASVATRADLEAQAARRSRLPTPSLFGGLKRADDSSGRVSGGTFGLNVSIPLFDSGSRESARWAAERALADATRAALQERIRADIVRDADTLALRQQALAADGIAAGDELMTIAEVAYREGDVGILELLDAVRTSSRARIRTIDIRLDARLAQIALERAVGDILWP